MSARIEGIVARLHGLHPRLIDLSLDRLRDLLAKLGHPEHRMPPVVHVAGTNGKGSTCAFVRAKRSTARAPPSAKPGWPATTATATPKNNPKTPSKSRRTSS